jgi:hypothetical protein
LADRSKDGRDACDRYNIKGIIEFLINYESAVYCWVNEEDLTFISKNIEDLNIYFSMKKYNI